LINIEKQSEEDIIYDNHEIQNNISDKIITDNNNIIITDFSRDNINDEI
jgi:hypothetical protein